MFSSILNTIQVRDVMTTSVVTVNETDDFALVTEKMEMHDIRHLPVVDASGQLVGLVTQRHLYRIHSPRRLDDGSWFYDKEALNSFILSKVMIQEVVTLFPDTTLLKAIATIVQHKLGCMVIVDSARRPVGILTRDDVLKLLLTQ